MEENRIVTLDFGDSQCEIMSNDGSTNPEMLPGWKKMDISDNHRGQLSALCGQLQDLTVAGELSKAYYVIEWPDGLPHKLTKAKDGHGFYGAVRGEKGQFKGNARFQSFGAEAAVLAGFTVMSLVTQQYFLAEINHKMTMISNGIDKILEFLYGDKKAELLAEINYIRYAYHNFSSIMEHDEQRIATIQSLQEARKTAIKDVEFYLADLYSTTHDREIEDMNATVDKTFQIRQCLDLSIQLYVMSHLLEVYYSQNYDKSYLEYVEADAGTYISKYEKQVLGCFNALDVAVEIYKPKRGKKFNPALVREKLFSAIERLSGGEETELKRRLHTGLYSVNNKVKYCVGRNGSLYMKV